MGWDKCAVRPKIFQRTTEMELLIDNSIKPLFANLKRLSIGEYLHTKEFSLFALEMAWDVIWERCRKEVVSKKTMFVFDRHNTEVEEEAFAYFLTAVLTQWRQKKPHDPLYFGSVIFPVLARFVQWSPIKLNFKALYKNLEELGLPLLQIKSFAAETEKRQEHKPMTFEVKPRKEAKDQIANLALKEVFVVHGHNRIILPEVCNVLEKLGLKPIVLHEQPNSGQTIIEKFESNAVVGAAIVLFTADDVGRALTEKKPKPRARQNVILELGYFVGKLGRNRVITLYEYGLELPSDISGVVHELLDPGGRWKFNVIKELKAMGYNVDANSIL
jgi:predicted nucleotide-binding protein